MFDLVQAMYTRFNVLLCCIHLNQSEVEWSFALHHKQQLKGINMVEIVIPEKSNIYVYLGLVSLFGLVLVFSSHKEELCSLTDLIVYVWPVYFRLPSPYYVTTFVL
jgi:hypothetical protein